jgi:DNA-binding beta-propeller fold protein YncE
MRLRVEFGVVGTALVVLWTGGLSWADSVKLRPLAPLYLDGEGAPIRKPRGVGCGASGVIVVADSGNARLLRYRVTEGEIVPLDVLMAPQLAQPVHVAVTSSDDVLALDAKQRRIVRFAASGQFQGYLELTGAAGEIVPKSFALDREDHLFVLDIFSERVLVADLGGAVNREISFPEEFGMLSDLVVDARGRVFVIDSVKKRLLVAGKEDSRLTEAKENLAGKAMFPTSLTADDSGNLYVADQNGGAILVVGADGAFRARQSGQGWKPGLLRYPSSLCIDHNDYLFVADRANNRIQIFAIIR